jgi:hypothetical protein
LTDIDFFEDEAGVVDINAIPQQETKQTTRYAGGGDT